MNIRGYFKHSILVTAKMCFLLISVNSIEAKAEHSTIVLTTDDLPPFFSKDIPNGGYFFEITKEAFSRAGYNLIVEWTPWKRAFIEAQKGTYAGVMGAYYNKERSKDFVFTNPIANADLSFFKRSEDSISYTYLHELQPYVIGVIRGTAPDQILSKVEPPLSIEKFSRDEQNIKSLISKRIDLFLTDLQYMNYILSNEHPELKNKIDNIHPTLRSEPIYNAISRATENHQKIKDDFNRALQQIRDDGTYDKILKRNGIKE